MTDTATIATTMTLAGYELFVAGRPDHERWELIGGAAEMMTNPLLNHGLIVGNIFAPLKVKLAGSDCRAFAGGLRVQRSEEATDTFATIPDIVVQCGPRPNRTFTTNAVAVVEVLSRSTMFRDRGAKFDFYRSLPSLRDIVLVYQSQMRVEHYRRTAEGWILSELVQPSDRLAFGSLDVAMELAAVYDDVPALRAVASDSEDDPAVPIP